jgi:hypothetical protein
LRKYYNKPVEKNLKSIVAGPKLLAVPKQIIPNSNNSRRHHTIWCGDANKYYMLSVTGTWDEIIKLH